MRAGLGEPCLLPFPRDETSDASPSVRPALPEGKSEMGGGRHGVPAVILLGLQRPLPGSRPDLQTGSVIALGSRSGRLSGILRTECLGPGSDGHIFKAVQRTILEIYKTT